MRQTAPSELPNATFRPSESTAELQKECSLPRNVPTTNSGSSGFAGRSKTLAKFSFSPQATIVELSNLFQAAENNWQVVYLPPPSEGGSFPRHE
mmetsp:Transcript_58418/g.92782  ORF Transcript_58418/g.92782 Transcript_58418/m.92782 type:complete len:94 (-) Transcript_58418:883-1164(-)